MVQIATEVKPIGASVGWEIDPDFTREPITIVTGAGKLVPGTVLGKITASGKFEPSPATGSSGSETAAAILVDAVDATSGDQVAMAIVNGPALVYPGHMTFASSVNDDTKKNAKLTQLKTINIKSVKGA